MRYVAVEREVHRRPEVVWDVLLDVGGLTAWIEGLVEARAAADEPLGVGSVIELVWHPGTGGERARVRGTSEITGFRSAELLAVETRIGSALFFDRIRLEGDSRTTRIDVVSEVMSGFGVADFFARPRGLLGAPNDETPLQRAYERSLAAFAKQVEAKSAIPYR